MSTYQEAPASFNVRAISPAGYDVQLTLRSEEGAELMPRALAALAWLEQHGFRPTGKQAHPASNGHGPNGTGAPLCPTHGRPMKPSRHGGFHCTAKIADDDGTGRPLYCRQKLEGA